MSEPQPPDSYDTPPTPADPMFPPEPPRRGRQRLLLLLASALGGFSALAVCGIAFVVLLNPAVRARLPFFGPAAPPEGPNKFASTGVGPVRIQDDFSSPNDRWDRSQTRVVNGAYQLVLELNNFDSYGLFLGANSVRDFDMAVDVTQVAGDPTSEFGIRFRQSAPDDHLIFAISGSGYYRLARVKDKTFTSVVPWTRDGRIRTGMGETNRLRVIAEGPTIRGFINDEQVLEYSDEEQAVGQLTLGVVTYFAGDLTVQFDNIEGFAMQTAPLDDVQPQRVEMAEDFSDPAIAPWSVGGATVNEGAYEVFVGGPVQSWQQPLPTGASQVEGDFVLEVEATLLSGSEGGSAYGIMFGDGGRFDFFSLYLLPEGGLMLVRNGPEGGMVIPPVRVESIKPGLGETNRISMEVRGSVMSLTINDEALPPLEFPEGVSFDGMAGVVLRSQDVEGVRARFDNFHLEEIQ